LVGSLPVRSKPINNPFGKGSYLGSLAAEEIIDFLDRLSKRYTSDAIIYVLGGVALCVLGNPRRTVDIDYTIEAPPDETQELIKSVQTLADEMKLELESVPLEKFIPLPKAAGSRHRWVGKFGSLAVYVFDPYSIALSKLARGFEADLQDIQFLLQEKIINLNQLGIFVEEALPKAWDYDIDPAELRLHFLELRHINS
jgi:hypothetical protein